MSAPKTVRVFIADDSLAMRGHVFGLMQDIPGVKIVGFASGEVEAVASIKQLKPDVVLLDIHPPNGSGLEILRCIKQGGRGPLTIVSTNFPFPQYRKRALELGADHFLDKTADMEVLQELIGNLTGALEPAEMN